MTLRKTSINAYLHVYIAYTLIYAVYYSGEGKMRRVGYFFPVSFLSATDIFLRVLDVYFSQTWQVQLFKSAVRFILWLSNIK